MMVKTSLKKFFYDGEDIFEKVLDDGKDIFVKCFDDEEDIIEFFLMIVKISFCLKFL